MTLRDDLEKVIRIVKSSEELGDYTKASIYSVDLLVSHGQALLEAVDAKRAIEEQAMVTECVSVDGRDPSDVIRDIISWHFEMDGCRKDAERWRRFERDAQVVNKARGVYLESQVMFGRMDDKPRDYIDALIAIEAAMEGER